MKETKTINVADYYGNPSYYSVMPQEIFNALESAYLKGEILASVPKTDFDQMVEAYKMKMGL